MSRWPIPNDGELAKGLKPGRAQALPFFFSTAIRGDSPRATIVVSSLLPVNFPWQPATLLPNLNAQLAEMCRSFDVLYLDLYGPFLAALEKGAAIFDDDGVHLGRLGYGLWGQALHKLFS